MLQHVSRSMGLDQVPVLESLTVLFMMGCTALFVGFLVQYVAEDRAFGSYLNGFLLFVFFCTSAVLYSELVQPVRASNPGKVLAIAVGGAFALLFLTVGIRNILEKR